jgi:hypothetical protein
VKAPPKTPQNDFIPVVHCRECYDGYYRKNEMKGETLFTASAGKTPRELF